jgi:hypothetical protein
MEVMRASALLRDVARNVRSGTARVGLFFSVAAAMLCLIVLAELLSVSTTVRQAVEYRESGAAVATLALPQRIDGRACEALGRAPNVIAAGAMRESAPVTSSVFPSSPLRQYQATSSFAAVLRSTDEGRGAYFSREVAESVGERSVLIAGEMVPMRGSFGYPSDGRRAGFGWAMLSPTRAVDGPFDECWVQMWPERSDIRQLLLTTLTPVSATAPNEEPVISQLNTKFGAAFAGVQDYQSRPTRHASAIALVVGAFLAAIGVWGRRIEIAANLHAGSPRGLLTAQYAMEVGAWALPAALCAWSVGCVTAALGAPTELAALTTRAGHIALVFMAAAVAGAVVGAFFVREEQLWSYVKGR